MRRNVSLNSSGPIPPSSWLGDELARLIASPRRLFCATCNGCLVLLAASWFPPTNTDGQIPFRASWQLGNGGDISMACIMSSAASRPSHSASPSLSLPNMSTSLRSTTALALSSFRKTDQEAPTRSRCRGCSSTRQSS